MCFDNFCRFPFFQVNNKLVVYQVSCRSFAWTKKCTFLERQNNELSSTKKAFSWWKQQRVIFQSILNQLVSYSVVLRTLEFSRVISRHSKTPSFYQLRCTKFDKKYQNAVNKHPRIRKYQNLYTFWAKLTCKMTINIPDLSCFWFCQGQQLWIKFCLKACFSSFIINL